MKVVDFILDEIKDIIADDKKWNDIIWIKFCMDRMKLIPKEEWDERCSNMWYQLTKQLTILEQKSKVKK